ncbi:hypothetical protein E2C01_086995 [Portunus trituberculatus]|uniref:Uncharacterized protein n=1 Tax=Portunus trituberculatus TaxID=210409 RepID=A0A5B7J5C0_PORTR|nr:hypothetical protein [Portunus trituberculatus]
MRRRGTLTDAAPRTATLHLPRSQSACVVVGFTLTSLHITGVAAPPRHTHRLHSTHTHARASKQAPWVDGGGRKARHNGLNASRRHTYSRGARARASLTTQVFGRHWQERRAESLAALSGQGHHHCHQARAPDPG